MDSILSKRTHFDRNKVLDRIESTNAMGSLIIYR
uniref:Envelope membrane protein n=1 Tax=Bougainvillea spectabilis TaxID=146096 RepID=A0A7T1T225_9CARY|nr:envelope membrane protein [Bougainvillea spectabilis]